MSRAREQFPIKPEMTGSWSTAARVASRNLAKVKIPAEDLQCGPLKYHRQRHDDLTALGERT